MTPVGLLRFPLWTTIRDLEDMEAIAGYGVAEEELSRELARFDGWKEGYDHPWYPVLDLDRGHSPELVRAQFTLPDGASRLGYLIDTFCFGIFFEEEAYIFNKNLPDLAKTEAERMANAMKLAPTLGDIRYEASLVPNESSITTGTIKAFW